ncbi:MAG: hypothetical protein V1917_02340 [Candidatus Gottesmanbacteria bacterium]
MIRKTYDYLTFPAQIVVMSGLCFFSFITCFGLLYEQQNPLSLTAIIVIAGICTLVSYVCRRVSYIRFIPMAIALSSIGALISSFVIPLPTPIICLMWLLLGCVMAFYMKKNTFFPRWMTEDCYLRILLFFIGLLFLSGFINNFCSVSQVMEFDGQNFFVWKYGALHGYVPMKDYFYLYGFLTYYQESSIVLRLILWIWMACLLVGSYGIIKKISGSTMFGCITFFLFLLVVQSETGYWYFYRYGTTIILMSWFALKFAEQKKDVYQLIILSGLCTGLLFFLLFDQGIYFGIAMSVFLLLRMSLNGTLNEIVHHYTLFTIGCLLGCMPLLVFCLYTHSLSEFFVYFSHFFTITAFAKVPYFPNALVMENMIATITIWVCGFFLIGKWFFQRKYFLTFHGSLQIGLFLLMMLFQYKNCMRPPVGGQFIPAIILVFMSFITLVYLKAKTILHSSVLPIMYCIIVIIGFSWMYRVTSFYYYDVTMFQNILNNFWFHDEGRQSKRTVLERCLTDELNRTMHTVDEIYQPVFQLVKKQTDFHGVLFIYPVDPIVYLLNGQVPAPYFNGYDATPKTAQENNIAYIEKNDIRYALYHQGPFEMDAVPNVLRNAMFLRYLFTHFEPIDQLGDYFLFRKSDSQVDGFKKVITMGDSLLSGELSDIDMGHISKTEGKKIHQLEREAEVIVDKPLSLDAMNDYLLSKPEYSDNLVIAMSFDTAMETSDSKTTMSIKSTDGLLSSVGFVPCFGSDTCIIHLSRLPHFFRSRIINHIVIADEMKGKYRLFRLKDDQKLLW